MSGLDQVLREIILPIRRPFFRFPLEIIVQAPTLAEGEVACAKEVLPPVFLGKVVLPNPTSRARTVDEPALCFINANVGCALFFNIKEEQVSLLELLHLHRLSHQVLVERLPGKGYALLLEHPLREA